MKKILATILNICIVFSTFSFVEFSEPKKAEAVTNIRQEVNITDAYMLATANNYATSSEIVAITDSNYSSPYYYFEVVASTTGATTATIDLVNATSSKKVATITMTGGQTSYARLRSTAFVPNASSTVEYKVVLNNENIGKGIIASRIVVLQNPASLTNTETQIEIGSATTSANNTDTLALQSPKYWYYDANKWDASPTFYAEVTYKDNPIASSTTYNVSATTTATFYKYIGSTGVGYVVGEAWGGGGGGDGASSGATIGGGGGGGGSYARSTTTAITAGSSNYIGVGRGGAEGTAKAVTASSTLILADGTTIVNAEGGEGATSGTGAATSTLSATTGDVKFAGGKGGDGETTVDTGGGGGGAAGPDGAGVPGGNAVANGPGGTGGKGDNNFGGLGGAGGNGGDDTCDTENGYAGQNNPLGGGGGGGADGDVSSVCLGGSGGKPGGGGGGSDEGVAEHLGGPGQVKITEWIGTVGIALEESDGTGDGFTGWTNKIQIVTAGKTSTTTERVRSSSFTPTSGRNYRLVASTTSSTASYDIYNAKIVVVQSAGGTLSASNLTTGSNTTGGTTYTTASVSPASNALILVTFVARNGSSVNPSIASISGNGLTWEKVNSIVFDSSGASRRTLEVWRSMGTPSAGQITITTNSASDTGAVWTVDQITGVDTSGSNGSGAVVQSATNSDESGLNTTLTVTLGAFSSANNGSWGSFGIAADVTWTVGGGFSSIGQSGDANANINSDSLAEFKTTNDTTVDETSTIDQVGGVAIEVKASTAGITKIQPQYLLANKKLFNDTNLQNFLTQYDSTEWNTTNAYITQAEAANGSNSVIGLYSTGGTLVANSSISTIDNRATSSPICLATAGTGTYDTKATNNNNDIYAFRILVDVGSSETPTGCGGAVFNKSIFNLFGQLFLRGSLLIR